MPNLPLTTATVGLAVTPTVLQTLLSHYVSKKPDKNAPTAHLSYHEGLHLIRCFLEYASHHTVEELQAFTAQWVPHPQWVKVEDVLVAGEHIDRAASLLEEQLGPEGIQKVGGRHWWQWRKPDAPLKAEWVEMRSDYNERKRKGDPGRRVMLYVHGGAYYFGSVDEHRYQVQRHARKLKARVLSPRYRLAPQFPFPCGLHDCLATYLQLLATQDPSSIVLAGDSAGGGMVLAMMVILRDRGLPLPAGAVLISPWCDLTHSFPSVADENPMDYIPTSGFHHRPSRAWPPPNEEDLATIRRKAAEKRESESKNPSPTRRSLMSWLPRSEERKEADTGTEKTFPRLEADAFKENSSKPLCLSIDGKDCKIKDQIQMYTTNELLSHPLVSPIMQPTLGGLPPLLIIVGGGEVLRDEQIYLAHKCANPQAYLPADHLLDEKAREIIGRYQPTNVQLQIWDGLCHVAPTLSFTSPAKFIYRSIAQFSAWALARAQKTGIDILADDDISIISNSDSEELKPGQIQKDRQNSPTKEKESPKETGRTDTQASFSVGKAGDPLPGFKDHMIRQRVSRHGAIYALEPPAELQGCQIPRDAVGVVKESVAKKWLATKELWDLRYAKEKQKVHHKLTKGMAEGYEPWEEGENPPPSALAGRRRAAGEGKAHRKTRSIGLLIWSLWGSKHDEMTVEREHRAGEEAVQEATETVTQEQGEGARPFKDIEAQKPPEPGRPDASRSRSRRRTVVDENQTGVDENTSVAALIELRKDMGDKENPQRQFLSPGDVPETGISGRRAMVNGDAMPFSLEKDPDSLSMLTLVSNMPDRAVSPMAETPGDVPAMNFGPDAGEKGKAAEVSQVEKGADSAAGEKAGENTGGMEARPQVDRFVTAAEDIPQAGETGKESPNKDVASN